MIPLIPRLVLDEQEVSKIIHQAPGDETKGDVKPEINRTIDSNINDSAREVLDGTHCNSSPSFLEQISIPGFIADPKKVIDKVQLIILELPVNLRTAPHVIKKVALEIPAHASEFAGNIPSTIAELPTTIVTWTSNGQNAITTTVNVIKDLPHRATFQWRHLFGVLAVMVLAPLLGEVVFFFPMNPVDDGPDENRSFIFGTMTLYQLFMILPWIETCNYAMPQVKIPIHARLCAVAVGLMVAKVIDVILINGIFTHEPVFPIPFSILVTGTLGTLPVVPILNFMTPKMNREKGDFTLLFLQLVAYWFSLCVVIGWAIGIQRLQEASLQYLILILYPILRFVCKVLVSANISIRLSPKRHIQLNLVVDIIFTRVQVATWPFIDTPSTLLALFASESSVVFWRYYNGVDRIQLWWRAILTAASLKESLDDEQNFISTRNKVKGITEACLTKSNKHIINLTLSEDKVDIVRSLTSCRPSLSLAESQNFDSQSSVSNASGKDDCEMSFHSDSGTTAQIPAIRSRVGDMISSTSSTEKNTIVMIGNDHRCDIESPSFSGVYYSDDDDDDDDDDDSMEIGVEPNAFASIMRRFEADDTESTTETENETDIEDANIVDVTDVDQDSQSFSSNSQSLREEEGKTPTTRNGETWEQRDLYHMVDSTGYMCVNIIVRINQQLIFIAVRNLPSSQHLNQSFKISDERWKEAQIYGSIFIVLMLGLVVAINYSSVFFSKKHGLEGKKLSLGRVLSYIFKENFWFLFFWLISTGALVSSAMVNHFGADFSMNFEYLSCLEEIQWPGCPSG